MLTVALQQGINGLVLGSLYVLVALGLTLIYGVLHIINFAHGALLTAAMFAAFFAYKLLGIDPYPRKPGAVFEPPQTSPRPRRRSPRRTRPCNPSRS